MVLNTYKMRYRNLCKKMLLYIMKSKCYRNDMICKWEISQIRIMNLLSKSLYYKSLSQNMMSRSKNVTNLKTSLLKEYKDFQLVLLGKEETNFSKMNDHI